MTTTPKHRLRWYQYSLRSLFVLTVLVAIAGSWFAWKRQHVERQRAAVRAIEAVGGWVGYDWDSPDPSAMRKPQRPGPAWLRAWLGDDFFAHVTVLNVDDLAVTDAELEYVKGLPQLRRLWLSRTKVTDAGLEHLQGLTELKELYLFNTKVTDAGLEHLQELTQLEELDLFGTQVTDAGLERLQGLTQLKFLSLNDTKVTDEGVQKLQQALPNCLITH